MSRMTSSPGLASKISSLIFWRKSALCVAQSRGKPLSLLSDHWKSALLDDPRIEERRKCA